MCGIVGFNWKNQKLVSAMASALSHRGPDDSGYYTDANVSLGHRRLSILDVSNRGHQPMLNSKNVIVFNGEIWNFKELRTDLETKGYKFKSNSDTEVILQGYAEYGDKICSLLDGMFAFALWDAQKKRLLLARDKIGKRPLYYHYAKGKIVFASEIKALLEHATIKRGINKECLSEYLTLRYSPDSLTMFEGIKKLPAGSYAIAQSGKLTIKSYYSLPDFSPTQYPDVARANHLISRSVEKRLISDVPIGIFLSGGLDSSAIVGYTSRFLKTVKTFSISFNSKVDESKYAQIIADEFKTDHKKITVGKDMLQLLPTVIYHLDEPLADPATLPTYVLAREVSKHVKVALSGEGGDEVFGGYDSFNYIPELKLLYNIPYTIRRAVISPLLKHLSQWYGYPRKQMISAFSAILSHRTLEQGFKELFYFPFSKSEIAALFPEATKDNAFDRCLQGNSLEVAAQKYYFSEWLPNDLLMKADKMGMAHGLEIRTPFLDKDLIAYFASLPYQAKHQRKLFRKVVSSFLPKVILNKKKQGFTLPLYEWFSDRATQARILPFIEKLKKRGIFNAKALEDLQKSAGFKNEHKLWTLLNFEIWCEIYLDKVDYRKIRI